MKRTIKNSVLALTIGLAFTACSGSGGKQTGEETAQQAATEQAATSTHAESKEVTQSNWQEVVKADFGIDFPALQGWTFSDVKSYLDGEKVVVTYKQDGEKAAKPREIAASFFNATKAISPKGNFAVEATIDEKGNGSSTTKAYTDYNDCDPVNELLGEDFVSAQWFFEKDGRKSISIGCTDGILIVNFETF
jgi:hypothetical protein